MRDERESGARALLNMGHTVGHALEVFGDYRRWLHGEAVAIGLVAEMRAAKSLGLAKDPPIERVKKLLKKFHLPAEVDGATLKRAMPHAASDKKRAGSSISLPFSAEVGHAELGRVQFEALLHALDA
jgi:3-dehydroquinate synthetase